MDPKWQFVCFLLAFVCFVAAALWSWEGPTWRRPSLVALGLAFFDLVYLVNAWKAI